MPNPVSMTTAEGKANFMAGFYHASTAGVIAGYFFASVCFCGGSAFASQRDISEAIA